MQRSRFFPYDWKVDSKQPNVTSIRIYGLDERDKTTCVRTDNFTPFVYIELPDGIDWDQNSAIRVATKIDSMMGEKKPIIKSLEYRKRLYYAHIDSKGKRKKFPYLFLVFSNKAEIRTLSYKIRSPKNIPGIGRVALRMHEQDANEVLQLTCRRNLPTAGWIQFRGFKVSDDEKITSCHNEFMVDYKNMSPYDSDKVPRPLVLSFDLEVYSSDQNTFPKAERLGDKIFQISCILGRQNDSDENYEKTILTLGEPSQSVTGEDVEIRAFNTEDDLVVGFTDYIQELQPNIIVGYNIFGFDIPYLIARATAPCMCFREFSKLGFLKDSEANLKTIKWSSSAYGTQEFEFLDAEGRLFVDLLPLVKRDYKMDTYSLKAISTYFIGETKDPLSAKGIFKCYDVGMKRKKDNTFGNKAKKAMGIVAKYCVQDSVIVLKLFEKLQTWIGLTEMAKVCNVPIFTLYTQGQQIKVFSQVYKRCMYDGYVVEKDGYIVKENEHYTGAHVFEPVPGCYEDVIPFDFTSLYPTTIIAYNICWSTLITDENIPDNMCNVFEWEDHQGCNCGRDTTVRKTRPKHIMCAKRRYRFLKEPIGILPEMLTDLLSARKNTKTQMKEKKKELKLADDSLKTDIATAITVLDKRQLAFKVSANSAYGAMGVQRGYLPFMPGAMVTTARGRESIQKVAQYIPEKYGGQLIYGDTDCVGPSTPVLIVDNNSNLLYKTVEEISDGNWKRINPNKEMSQAKPGYKIWSDQGFTEIKNVVRCGVKKPVSRILVHTGHVICSNEHSLLRENLESVKPCDLNLKEKLCITNLPLPQDTPVRPIYPNNLTAEKIRDYKISDEVYENLSAQEAFVWGVFFADGSCGAYETKWGIKNSWTISKGDNLLLERCASILRKYEIGLDFKILDTMKSSKANKLVSVSMARGSIGLLVEKYRELFYNDRKLKKIPDILFNAPYKIREAFFMGYYAGDGSKKDPALCITNKGEIGTAGIFFIMRSIGYRVSINTRKDKPDTYKLTGSSPEKKQRYAPNVVKKIEDYSNDFDYIYDIETENHHFAAGIGEMVVHNSNYIHFPHMIGKTAEELWEYSEMVAEDTSKLFPAPMRLEFEEIIYRKFFIITKKRYMSLACGKDGIVSDKIEKKGVILARRDNAKIVRDIYAENMLKVFHKVPTDQIYYELIETLNKMFCMHFPHTDFIITKSVKGYNELSLNDMDHIDEEPFNACDIKEDTCLDRMGNHKKDKDGKPMYRRSLMLGEYKIGLWRTLEERQRKFKTKKISIPENPTPNDMKEAIKEYCLKSLPAQAQLAEKMRNRGKPVSDGTRLEYVMLTDGTAKSVKEKKYDKIESAEYYKEHSGILRIDYLCYLQNLASSLDQVLNVVNKKQDFVLEQFNIRLQKLKVLEELKDLVKPTITFSGSKIVIIE